MSATLRWTLLQALAWVLTRDHDLVAEIVRPAADGAAYTPMWLIVNCARGREDLSLTRDAWLPLAVRIGAGDERDRIRADGRPALPGHAVSDRQPLTRASRDLQIKSEHHTPGRECFLSGDSDDQRNWYDVELFACDVEYAFPGANAQPQATSSSPTKRTIPGQQQSVLEAVAALFPEGIGPGYPAQQRNHDINQWLRRSGRSASEATIRRALSAIDRS